MLRSYDPTRHDKVRNYYEDSLQKWNEVHNIQIKNDSHYEQILENYATNDDFIHRNNKLGLSYSVKHNQFSHMSSLEWKELRKRSSGNHFRKQVVTDPVKDSTLLTPPTDSHPSHTPPVDPIPPTSTVHTVHTDRHLTSTSTTYTSFDWSKVPNIVTPVKNQGLCGACYAFAAVATLECAYNIVYAGSTGMMKFSEQQVRDIHLN